MDPVASRYLRRTALHRLLTVLGLSFTSLATTGCARSDQKASERIAWPALRLTTADGNKHIVSGSTHFGASVAARELLETDGYKDPSILRNLPGATGSTIVDLASRDSIASRRAVSAMLDKAMESVRPEKDEPDRWKRHDWLAILLVSTFGEEWRQLETRKADLVAQLESRMADPETDLVAVNLIAYVLASSGSGLSPLTRLLGHDDFSISTYAAEGLAAIGRDARPAVPALRQALVEFSQSDWSTWLIVRALGRIGDQRSGRRQVIPYCRVRFRVFSGRAGPDSCMGYRLSSDCHGVLRSVVPSVT